MPTHLTVKGVVLRETAYGEADKLFDLLTDHGIRTVRARSVRKAGSKYAAVTQVFSYGEFCLRQSGDRFYLDSAVSLNLFYGLRNDLEALSLASYFSELIRKVATDQPQPQILRLLLHCLYYLSEHTRPPHQIKAIFELRLMTELGMMPTLICCPICLQYIPQHPVLRIASADMICEECRLRSHPYDLSVTPSALQAARHVIFSEFDKLFHFRVKGESLDLFSLYAEQYLLFRIDGSFPTLKFYQELTGMDRRGPSPYDTGNGNIYDYKSFLQNRTFD